MLTNSMSALEDSVEAAPFERFSHTLRSASALPGFGGWVEVTVRANVNGGEALTELSRLVQEVIRDAKAGPPWSVRTTGPYRSQSHPSLSMKVVFPETDRHLQDRLGKKLQALGVSALPVS